MDLVISTFVRRISEDLFEVKAILMSLSINVLHCGVMMFFFSSEVVHAHES